MKLEIRTHLRLLADSNCFAGDSYSGKTQDVSGPISHGQGLCIVSIFGQASEIFMIQVSEGLIRQIIDKSR